MQHVQPARAGPWEEEARRIEEQARRMARNAETEAERAADRARSQTSQWASQDPDFVRERVTIWVQDQSNWSRLALPLLGTVGIALLFGMFPLDGMSGTRLRVCQVLCREVCLGCTTGSSWARQILTRPGGVWCDCISYSTQNPLLMVTGRRLLRVESRVDAADMYIKI